MENKVKFWIEDNVLSFGEAVDRIERMGTNNKTICVTDNPLSPHDVINIMNNKDMDGYGVPEYENMKEDDDLLSEEEIRKLRDEWV